MDVSKLARAYVKLRDTRSANKKTFEQEDAVLKGYMEQIEAQMLLVLNEGNIDSINTPAGTFYRQEDITPQGADWGAFYQWVREEDAFDFLEKRIKKGPIKEYMEQHEGALPPGVSVFRKFEVRVRRS
jgi:hypothetical protein